MRVTQWSGKNLDFPKCFSTSVKMTKARTSKELQSEAHHGDEAPDEAEVREVVGVDGGGRVDLQTVVVLAGVFEQTVHGVQHLVGQQEEPLPVERERTSHYTPEERCHEHQVDSAINFLLKTPKIPLLQWTLPLFHTGLKSSEWSPPHSSLFISVHILTS